MDNPTDSKTPRSPLLPIRHQPDFFVCDVVDAAFKADQAAMEHPIYTLSTKPQFSTKRYENGNKWLEVRPSSKGSATVMDRDLIIYCISQLIAGINAGRPIGERLRMVGADIIKATNRADGGGNNYRLLIDAFERLQGTQIVTNVKTGGREIHHVFSLLKDVRLVRQDDSRDGKLLYIDVELSDWIYNAVSNQEVLTLNRRYFQLAKPIERRLYELARKHVGYQTEFRITLDLLRSKMGSDASAKEFRRLLRKIIHDDLVHDYMPEYRFELLQDDMVVMTRKEADTASLPLWNSAALKPATRTKAQDLAPGMDVAVLEQDWREWLVRKDVTPKHPDAHFLAFCRRQVKASTASSSSPDQS